MRLMSSLSDFGFKSPAIAAFVGFLFVALISLQPAGASNCTLPNNTPIGPSLICCSNQAVSQLSNNSHCGRCNDPCPIDRLCCGGYCLTPNATGLCPSVNITTRVCTTSEFLDYCYPSSVALCLRACSPLLFGQTVPTCGSYLDTSCLNKTYKAIPASPAIQLSVCGPYVASPLLGTCTNFTNRYGYTNCTYKQSDCVCSQASPAAFQQPGFPPCQFNYQVLPCQAGEVSTYCGIHGASCTKRCLAGPCVFGNVGAAAAFGSVYTPRLLGNLTAYCARKYPGSAYCAAVGFERCIANANPFACIPTAPMSRLGAANLHATCDDGELFDLGTVACVAPICSTYQQGPCPTVDNCTCAPGFAQPSNPKYCGYQAVADTCLVNYGVPREITTCGVFAASSSYVCPSNTFDANLCHPYCTCQPGTGSTPIPGGNPIQCDGADRKCTLDDATYFCGAGYTNCTKRCQYSASNPSQMGECFILPGTCSFSQALIYQNCTTDQLKFCSPTGPNNQHTVACQQAYVGATAVGNPICTCDTDGIPTAWHPCDGWDYYAPQTSDICNRECGPGWLLNPIGLHTIGGCSARRFLFHRSVASYADALALLQQFNLISFDSFNLRWIDNMPAVRAYAATNELQYQFFLTRCFCDWSILQGPVGSAGGHITPTIPQPDVTSVIWSSSSTLPRNPIMDYTSITALAQGTAVDATWNTSTGVDFDFYPNFPNNLPDGFYHVASCQGPSITVTTPYPQSAATADSSSGDLPYYDNTHIPISPVSGRYCSILGIPKYTATDIWTAPWSIWKDELVDLYTQYTTLLNSLPTVQLFCPGGVSCIDPPGFPPLCQVNSDSCNFYGTICPANRVCQVSPVANLFRNGGFSSFTSTVPTLIQAMASENPAYTTTINQLAVLFNKWHHLVFHQLQFSFVQSAVQIEFYQFVPAEFLSHESVVQLILAGTNTQYGWISVQNPIGAFYIKPNSDASFGTQTISNSGTFGGSSDPGVNGPNVVNFITDRTTGGAVGGIDFSGFTPYYLVNVPAVHYSGCSCSSFVPPPGTGASIPIPCTSNGCCIMDGTPPAGAIACPTPLALNGDYLGRNDPHPCTWLFSFAAQLQITSGAFLLPPPPLLPSCTVANACPPAANFANICDYGKTCPLQTILDLGQLYCHFGNFTVITNPNNVAVIWCNCFAGIGKDSNGRCTVSPCANNMGTVQCNGHGTRTATGCFCDPGYTGSCCEGQNTCSHNGQCSIDPPSNAADCNPGDTVNPVARWECKSTPEGAFSGVCCDQFTWYSTGNSTCFNGGVVAFNEMVTDTLGSPPATTFPLTNPYCGCSNPYTGPLCNFVTCPVTANGICNGQGSCVNGQCQQVKNGISSCLVNNSASSFTGCGCDVNVTAACVQPGTSLVCSGRGACIPSATLFPLQYNCSCETGFNGTYCESTPCGTENCNVANGGGVCILSPGNNHCQCSLSGIPSAHLFTGVNCDVDVTTQCGVVSGGQNVICAGSGFCYLNTTIASTPPVPVNCTQLKTAGNYTILAGSAITVAGSGPTTIIGNIGISPSTGTSVTGFPPGTYSGGLDAANARAVQAQLDLTSAYSYLAALTPATTIGTELSTMPLFPGVYTSASGTFGLTGIMTLDGQNNNGSVWVFEMATTLTTAGASSMLLINGAQPGNVYWRVGSSATLGASSTFIGNILALTSISVGTTATITGRLLAQNGAVTFAGAATVTPPPLTANCTNVTTSITSQYQCQCTGGYTNGPNGQCTVSPCATPCNNGFCDASISNTVPFCHCYAHWTQASGCTVSDCGLNASPSALSPTATCVCNNPALSYSSGCTLFQCPSDTNGNICGVQSPGFQTSCPTTPACPSSTCNCCNNGTCSCNWASILNTTTNLCQPRCDPNNFAFLNTPTLNGRIQVFAGCTCKAGFDPATNCATPLCFNGGTPLAGGGCACPFGFGGAQCNAAPCNNQGFANSTTTNCTCFFPWNGTACASNVCLNGGIGVANGPTAPDGKCQCLQTFSGRFCEIDRCAVAQSGMSDPSDPTGETCLCTGLLTGQFCDICPPTAQVLNGTCFCTAQYVGPTCSYRRCASAGVYNATLDVCVCGGVSTMDANGNCTMDLCGPFGTPNADYSQCIADPGAQLISFLDANHSVWVVPICLNNGTYNDTTFGCDCHAPNTTQPFCALPIKIAVVSSSSGASSSTAPPSSTGVAIRLSSTGTRLSSTALGLSSNSSTAGTLAAASSSSSTPLLSTGGIIGVVFGGVAVVILVTLAIVYSSQIAAWCAAGTAASDAIAGGYNEQSALLFTPN